MRLIHLVPSLERRYGGPSVSVPGLASALAQAGHTVELFSTMPGIANTTTTGTLVARTFPRTWPHAVGAATGLYDSLKNSRGDIVHHHALWLRTLHYAHQFSKQGRARLVISPRGMMSAWAWRHHRARKLVARRLIHPGAFAAAHGWHATSEEEAADIRRLGFTQPICVAPNGITLPPAEQHIATAAAWHERVPATGRRPVALFYSRFHRKKRVRELVNLWLAAPRGDWLLLLVGIPEEYSVAEVQGWINAARGQDRIVVFDGSSQPPPYAVASLFILPSHSENFGLVVAEAMAAGLPVIVTDTTPWAAVNQQDRGWCVPWEAFNSTLNKAIAEGPDRLAERGARARAWVTQEYSWAKSARILTDFYAQLVGATP